MFDRVYGVFVVVVLERMREAEMEIHSMRLINSVQANIQVAKVMALC